MLNPIYQQMARCMSMSSKFSNRERLGGNTMKEQFEEYNFGATVSRRIDLANQVLAEYQAAGYTLTIRQLYYQLVARGYIENTQQSYKRIVDAMTKARYAGLVDWEAIEDRTRSTMRPPEWNNHIAIARIAQKQFRLPRWHDQPNHVEVFIEKEALAGVFQPLVYELHINITANRGYSSASEMWRHAKRLQYLHRHGKKIYVFYCGDHDPSGLDMDRDITDRLDILSHYAPFEFERLALTWSQVAEYNPPPNPAKLTDSRAEKYIDEWGYESWELDALEPQVLAGLVRDAVLPLRDDDIYDPVIELEEEMRADLKGFADQETELWTDNYADRWPLGPNEEN